MYCYNCGKEVPDGAKFCPMCATPVLKVDSTGKVVVNNEIKAEPQALELIAKSNSVNIKALVCSLVSLIIEAVMILLSLTDLFCVKVGNSYISYSYDISAFDLLDNAKSLSSMIHTNSTAEEISNGMLGFGIVLLVCSGISLLYLIFNISTYSILNSNRNTGGFGRCYNEYSPAPALLFAVASIVGLVIFGANIGEYGSVSPSVSLVFIYILTVVQIVINKVYCA